MRARCQYQWHAACTAAGGPTAGGSREYFRRWRRIVPQRVAFALVCFIAPRLFIARRLSTLRRKTRRQRRGNRQPHCPKRFSHTLCVSRSIIHTAREPADRIRGQAAACACEPECHAALCTRRRGDPAEGARRDVHKQGRQRSVERPSPYLSASIFHNSTREPADRIRGQAAACAGPPWLDGRECRQYQWRASSRPHPCPSRPSEARADAQTARSTHVVQGRPMDALPRCGCQFWPSA